MSVLTVYTDGASKGNPGDAGIGVVISDENDNVVDEISEYVGIKTNNAAEYLALLAACKKAKELRATRIEIFTDSELMARQIAGIYKVKSEALRELHAEVIGLLRQFESASISHVLRDLNKRADELANEAVKKHQRSVAGKVDSPKEDKKDGNNQFELDLSS